MISKFVKPLCFVAGAFGTLGAGSVYVLANQKAEPVDLLLTELLSVKNQSGRQAGLIDKIKVGGLENDFKIEDNSFVNREKAKQALNDWCKNENQKKDFQLFNKYCR